MKKRTNIDNEEERVRLKMLMLRAECAYHKHMYYIQEDIQLGDTQYDELEKEFAEICEHIKRTYPEMYKIYNPKPWVGAHHTGYGYPKEEG